MDSINTLFNRQIDFLFASERNDSSSQKDKIEKLRKVLDKLAKSNPNSSAASTPSEQEMSLVTTTRPPCLCTTDPKHRRHAAAMDTMLSNGYHNLVCSPLTGLPEDILLNIMQRLPAPDLHHLRHTSRLFLRLQESRPFGPWATAIPDPMPCPWDVPRFYTNLELRRLLNPSGSHPNLYGLCDACCEVRTRHRTSWHMKWLWDHRLFCSMCNVFHPQAAFSAAQRQNSDRRVRACQAHEGTVRLCSHKRVDLMDIKIAVQAAMQENDDKAAKMTILLATCDHVNHCRSAAHHLDINPLLCAPRMDLVIDVPKLRVSIVHKWVGHLAFASASSVSSSSASLSSSTSPPPPPPFPPPNATHAVLKHRIEKELRPGAAEFIVPRLGSGNLLEMHCVDPVRCDCLEMPGRECLPHGWRLPADPVRYKPMWCRTGAGDGLWTGKIKTRDENRNGESSTDAEWPCHEATYWRSHNESDGISKVSVEMACCGPTERACIQVHYSSHIDVMDLWYRRKGNIGLGHVLPTWYLALDPCSYGFEQDKIGRGFTWCDNPECKPNVHRLRHPVIRIEDLHWYRDTICGRLGKLERLYPKTWRVKL